MSVPAIRKNNPFTSLFSDIPSPAPSYTKFNPLVNDHELPNFAISYSLYILNAGSCLREAVLSSREIDSTLKTGTILVISLLSTAIFTLSTLIEAISRIAIAILLLPVVSVTTLFDPETANVFAIISGLLAFSGVYNFAILGTGFLGAYEMVATDATTRLRDVTEIADTASFGWVSLVKNWFPATTTQPTQDREDLYA